MNQRPSESCDGGCSRAPIAPVAVREAGETDTGFIVSSWSESWHRGSPQMRDVRFAYYREPMRRRVLALLSRSVTLVACPFDDVARILAWCCVEKRAGAALVHYVYTREGHREVGLASALLREARSRLRCETPRWTYSHPTYVGQRAANRQGHECDGYDPLACWDMRAEETKEAV